MTELPKIDPDNDAGLGWWIVARHYVLMRCPQDHVFTLSTPVDGHTIHAAGDVSPSVVCPYKGCSFHEAVRLVGWVPLAPAP